MTDRSPGGMAGVLDGIRVIEVAHFAYVPSAAAVLGDWGADVVKIENPHSGDPMRGVTIGGIPPGTSGFTFMWELSNRNKRSVGIDLSTEAGRDLLLDLVAEADVFITSFLPGVRAKLRIDEADIRERNPQIVYAVGSGQGARGAEADMGGFDQTSYWYRAGVASALVAPGERPPDLPGAGFGDVSSGMALAGGIAAALVRRERTGLGTRVDGSLLAMGMWAMQPSIVATGLTGDAEFRFQSRLETSNPLVNTYRTSDGRFIGLCVIHADKHWPELCHALGRPDLVSDERFVDATARDRNSAACVTALDEIFAGGDLDHWIRILGSQGAQWAVIQRVSDLHDDPQVSSNGYLQHVDYGGGRAIDLVVAPVQHDGRPAMLSPAPELGANTEDVLLGLGIDWDTIIELKERQIIT